MVPIADLDPAPMIRSPSRWPGNQVPSVSRVGWRSLIETMPGIRPRPVAGFTVRGARTVLFVRVDEQGSCPQACAVSRWARWTASTSCFSPPRAWRYSAR